MLGRDLGKCDDLYFSMSMQTVCDDPGAFGASCINENACYRMTCIMKLERSIAPRKSRQKRVAVLEPDGSQEKLILKNKKRPFFWMRG